MTMGTGTLSIYLFIFILLTVVEPFLISSVYIIDYQTDLELFLDKEVTLEKWSVAKG